MRDITKFSIVLLIFFAVLILSAGCSTDNPASSDEHSSRITLHHDTENLAAPTLPADTYEGAARFTAADTGNAANARLVEIHYYIAQLPNVCVVKVYGPNSADLPGNLLYSADVMTSTSAQGWNIHELQEPIVLTGEDVWLSIEFSHTDQRAVLGCDPGPAVKDGDWLLTNVDNEWLPLSTRTQISINWNVRGIVETQH